MLQFFHMTSFQIQQGSLFEFSSKVLDTYLLQFSNSYLIEILRKQCTTIKHKCFIHSRLQLICFYKNYSFNQWYQWYLKLKMCETFHWVNILLILNISLFCFLNISLSIFFMCENFDLYGNNYLPKTKLHVQTSWFLLFICMPFFHYMYNRFNKCNCCRMGIYCITVHAIIN